MPEQPDVRVGQEWADADPRSAGRRIRVLELVEETYQAWRPSLMRYEAITTRYARVQVVAAGVLVGRPTRIRIDRFRPTSHGYRLVLDVLEAAR